MGIVYGYLGRIKAIINVLVNNYDIGEELLSYGSFTDIEFNPKKSINCQAKAVAIYVGFCQAQRINEAEESSADFRKIVYGNETVNDESRQLSLKDFGILV